MRNYVSNVSKKIMMAAMIAVLTLVIAGLCAGCGQGGASDAGSQRSKTAEYFAENAPYKYGDEWVIIGLAESGEEIDPAVFESYYDSVRGTVKSKKGVLSEDRYTEYARVALGAKAIGKDPTDVEGYDILAPLDDWDNVTKQGWNGPAYALIAANTCGYQLKNEDKYVDYLVKEFEKSKEGEMVDVTAILVQALSYYRDRPDVNELVNSSLDNINKEFEDGGKTFGTCESTAQVILATESCDGDGTLYMEDLLSYADGPEFKHVEEQSVDRMATEQALMAMNAAADE